MLLPTPLEAETLIDVLMRRLQEKAADTIESLHKAGMKVWVLTGDKMETAAATCYASKLFRRSTQILELTKKRTEEQSLHDVLFELNRTVLRQRSISGYEIMHADIYCILGLQLILIYCYHPLIGFLFCQVIEPSQFLQMRDAPIGKFLPDTKVQNNNLSDSYKCAAAHISECQVKANISQQGDYRAINQFIPTSDVFSCPISSPEAKCVSTY